MVSTCLVSIEGHQNAPQLLDSPEVNAVEMLTEGGS
jgi:hypothetical protein